MERKYRRTKIRTLASNSNLMLDDNFQKLIAQIIHVGDFHNGDEMLVEYWEYEKDKDQDLIDGPIR